MATRTLSFSGTVLEYFSEKVSGGWFLVSLPPDVGEELEQIHIDAIKEFDRRALRRHWLSFRLKYLGPHTVAPLSKRPGIARRPLSQALRGIRLFHQRITEFQSTQEVARLRPATRCAETVPPYLLRDSLNIVCCRQRLFQLGSLPEKPGRLIVLADLSGEPPP
jgi:hypothetical protein